LASWSGEEERNHADCQPLRVEYELWV